MIRPISDRIAILGCAALLLTGCKKKFDVELTAQHLKMKQDDKAYFDDLTPVIAISAKPKDPSKGAVISLSAEGKVAFRYHESGMLVLRASDLPVGQSKLKVRIVGVKTGLFPKRSDVEFTEELEVTRNPLGPHLITSEGSCGYHKEGVCIDPHTTDKDGNVNFKFYGQPGTKLDIEGKVSTISSDGSARVSVNVGNRLLPLAVGTPLDVLVKVTSPEGVIEMTKAEVKTGDALNETMKAVATGPVLLFGESPTRGSGKGIFVTGGKGRVLSNVPLKDIEYIGLETSTYRSRSCGSYKNSKTGEIREASVSAYDAVVTAYVRKTGKKIATKTFPAVMPSCASVITAGQAQSGNAGSSSGGSGMDAWLRTVCK